MIVYADYCKPNWVSENHAPCVKVYFIVDFFALFYDCRTNSLQVICTVVIDLIKFDGRRH